MELREVETMESNNKEILNAGLRKSLFEKIYANHTKLQALLKLIDKASEITNGVQLDYDAFAILMDLSKNIEKDLLVLELKI
ncbi:hypothetical protein STFE110948_02880 [Streptobacillus felis]|uniref:hypothetical protein n=1 Tax=Streptobacillus felis TaxID=1384509 RepID=UPI00082DD86B|nr:hypothetical protein [Streptobacillus felis]